jgi:hypothetical protein
MRYYVTNAEWDERVKAWVVPRSAWTVYAMQFRGLLCDGTVERLDISLDILT